MRNLLSEGWDLLIAHPPCTYLCNSGVRWLFHRGTRDRVEERWSAMREGAAFFEHLWSGHSIPRVAVENPIMHCHAKALITAGDAAQVIQPWMFGHGETKATCLWLRNLPLLTPTNIVDGREHRVHLEPPGPDRWKNRSRTFEGIAEAMAVQWGSLCPTSGF